MDIQQVARVESGPHPGAYSSGDQLNDEIEDDSVFETMFQWVISSQELFMI